MCSCNRTLPFCLLERAGLAPLVSHAAAIGLGGFIRIAIPIYAIGNGVRWRDALSFFFTGAQRKK